MRSAESPVAIVDSLSLELYKGKTLALVGESGCGKSMTALSIMKILPHPPALPPTGEVIYQGRNLLTFSEKEMRTIRGGKIAMIFQDPTTALNPVYTIGNQLIEAAELHLNLYGDEAAERAVIALTEVGISSPWERLQSYPHQLSGGMRQRVMIAMALMCEPDILIADEPTTALDVTIQAQILDLIRSLQKKKEMAVLLITHDMGVVAEMADDVIVMYAAQDVERGPVKRIFDNMAHPYTQELFASRAAIHPPKSPLHTIKGNVPSPEDFPRGCRFHPRCPFAMKVCLEGDVPRFPVENSTDQMAKCWLHDSLLTETLRGRV
jgi:oligopeptide/dipeptide ABC transporter ATP-binding protein